MNQTTTCKRQSDKQHEHLSMLSVTFIERHSKCQQQQKEKFIDSKSINRGKLYSMHGSNVQGLLVTFGPPAQTDSQKSSALRNVFKT